MSPAANTPGRLVAMVVSTGMKRLPTMCTPQSRIGPRLAVNPRAAITAGRPDDCRSVCRRDLDGLHALAAVHLADLGIGDDIDRRRVQLLDGVRVRAERGPAVHQGHAEGDGLQAQLPVAGTVTAADH